MDDDAIVIADTAGIIRFWSTGAEKLFGHTAATALGQSLDLIVPTEYREAHWRGFQRAIASGSAEAEGQASTFPARMACGETATLAGRLTLVRQMQGKVIAAMMVFQ
ncbi:MAG TPA: PAS domain S-box protein [Rhizomicrobium sp.]|nr:PAS domain S-box protein [Rhizomicrobium sp.]